VRHDLGVQLVVPEDWQKGEIDRLLSKKATWIEEKQTFFRKKEATALTLAFDEVMLFGERLRIEVDGCLDAGFQIDRARRTLRVAHAFASNKYLRRWQREFAKTFLSQRTKELSEKHGLKFGRLFVRSQRTKWGNCSVKRNISLNWRLICAPERVIDYLILHELLHTKIMNHSQTFWIHLHVLCPSAKEAIAWLNAHQPEFYVKPEPA
jgi:predicted metal-dependent hydrolase